MTGPQTPADYAAAMDRVRANIEKRMRADEAAPQKAAKRPSFDYRGLSYLVRERIDVRGMGFRGAAAEIGVTASDLSRIGGAQGITFEKVDRDLRLARDGPARALHASHEIRLLQCRSRETRERGRGEIGMTDTMLPVLRQFHDAGDDRERARLLLQMPDSIVVKFRGVLDAACARSGFDLGIAYLDVRWSEFLAVRDTDGRKTNPLFEQVRADFAAFAAGDAGEGEST